MTPVTQQAFKALVGSFPTGVTIVTARDTDGSVHGATVSAFTSVSMEPPIVMVSLATNGGLAHALRRAPAFAVNVLRADQKDRAVVFSKPGDRFDGVELRSCDVALDGVPVLCDTLATLLCRKHYAGGYVGYIVGDHTLFFGEVVGGRAREGEPLIHGLGRFACMRELP